MLIRKALFGRLVREITAEIATKITKHVDRWTGEALNALQEASEAYITGILEDSNLATIASKRFTVMPKDMQLVRQIRGELAADGDAQVKQMNELGRDPWTGKKRQGGE